MKKNTLLPIIFILISTLTFGQNFGEVGTQWFYSEHAGGNCPGNCEYLHLESVKDTVISGQTTHKITQTYYKRNRDTVKYAPIYLYEQSDTVFRWSFSKSRFLSLYIFNGNVGDTLKLDAPDTLLSSDTTYRIVIDTIINDTVDGVPLKKFGTTALDDYQFHYTDGFFMERIGGLDWFFPRGTMILESGGPIRCYSNAQIDTSFQAVACDHISYTSIDEYSVNNNILIYPNPTSGTFTIQSKETIKKIELFDLKGKLIRTTPKLNIDISDLPKGTYILKVHLNSEQKVEKKIIKTDL